jgi:OmcA/MtrC family decaheme c-type cytochrome
MTIESITRKMKGGMATRIGGMLLLLAVAISMTGAKKSPYGPHDKATYADATLVEFLRPGLTITITSATMSSTGVITAVYTLTDSAGLPLDPAGVDTPGAISLSYISAYIPNNAEQYVTYNLRTSTGAAGTFMVPTGDSGGTLTQLSSGAWQYVFKTPAPAGFDPTATNTVAIYGSRTLSAFNYPNDYASTTYNFVPNGAKVTKIRDVVATASCDSCHDQLSFHGGSRRGVSMCVMCHTPAMVDASTGQSVDFKVFIHKLHLGSSLPSVVAGTPYLIGTTNFSNIVFPATSSASDGGVTGGFRCTVCHDATKATQAKNYLIPTAVACGSCHDNVNLATGQNHAGGPQPNDTMCADCHIPQGELPFDASVIGAHMVPEDAGPGSAYPLLGGVAITLTSVTNGAAGKAPTVNFNLLDGNGKPLPLSSMASITFMMAGPTTDYGNTSFGSTVATPGYVTESALATTTCSAAGACSYTFTHPVPAGAKGSFAISFYASRTAEVLLSGTTAQQTVTESPFNNVIYFSVDGTPVVNRRTVVTAANCNNCHYSLGLHGGSRKNPEMCIMCHNPSLTDSSTRATAVSAAQKALPALGVNFNLLIHRIHTGVNLPPLGASYTVVGYQGVSYDFTTILYPPFSPAGVATDTENCSMCHAPNTETYLPLGFNPTINPQGLINPAPAITAACTGCHADVPSAAHFVANTDSLGESCTVCHSSTGAYSVSSVHAQY